MTTYRCTSCGYQTARWMGFCPRCTGGALEETAATSVGNAVPLVPVGDERRAKTGHLEVDRVLGGGVVPGAALLLSGEPGIGKSTLGLQLAASMATDGAPTLVVSGEESAHQVGMRGRRIGTDLSAVLISSERTVAGIVSQAASVKPGLLVVDSIQTVEAGSGNGIGGPSQVRGAAAALITFAKDSDVPVLLIGHVTKDGSIAGPKLLEHMVDVVMSLDGETDAGLRFLRASKNRFGSVNEIGVFAMTEFGLETVPDPSTALVDGRDATAPGSVLFPTVDGRRSMLVEVQALTVRTDHPQPRRSAKGVPPARLHQVLAVLERHAGVATRGHDVYLSVMGGVRIAEPAADLPIALAVASSVSAEPVGSAAAWGEVGLTGELRSVVRSDARRREVHRFGVDQILAPGEGVRRIEEAVSLLSLGDDRVRQLGLVR